MDFFWNIEICKRAKYSQIGLDSVYNLMDEIRI